MTFAALVVVAESWCGVAEFREVCLMERQDFTSGSQDFVTAI